MDGETIRTLLAQLGERIARRGLRAELFIVGGAAMALVYDDRRTTSDIDAILHPRDEVLNEAAAMASEHGLSAHWLSDAVRQMMPPAGDDAPRTLGEFGGLAISIGSPQYLLAMKAMVSRKSPSDLDDAARLCIALDVTTADQVERIVRRYFGTGTFGAQELWFEDILDRAATLRDTR
jgi:hypothetical protein